MQEVLIEDFVEVRLMTLEVNETLRNFVRVLAVIEFAINNCRQEKLGREVLLRLRRSDSQTRCYCYWQKYSV